MGGPAIKASKRSAKAIEARRKAEQVNTLDVAPFMLKLKELRNRVIAVLLAFGLAFGLCFAFAVKIYDFLVIPFSRAAAARTSALDGVDQELQLIYTAPLEFFFVKVKLALFGGIVLASPVILFEIYRFIAPSLYKDQKWAVIPYMIFAPVLFLIGAALAHGVVLPFVMEFALAQEQSLDQGRAAIELLPRVADYLAIVVTLILAFGAAFQLPVAMSLLARGGLVDTRGLVENWKVAVVAAFAFAMFVTPPDPFSQILLGGALMALYGVSVVCVWLVERRDAQNAAETDAA
ncbi:MAG: twin-arginine translocase subunit TatC [Maricaulaceae bacterium]